MWNRQETAPFWPLMVSWFALRSRVYGASGTGLPRAVTPPPAGADHSSSASVGHRRKNAPAGMIPSGRVHFLHLILRRQKVTWRQPVLTAVMAGAAWTVTALACAVI